MQLHVCLLLFIITTDKTLASSVQLCGGNVSLDPEPNVGHITITLPGRFTATDPINQTQFVCTWEVDIPVGRTVLLKALWLESGSNISVSCVRSPEDQDQVFESGKEAQLSGCDRNKATLTWTGHGHSLNGTLQLSYYVQEDERNSSEDHTSPHSDPTQTGTSFTSTAPISEKTVRGLGGVRGRFCEGPGPSCQDQGLLLPTSPLQRHAEAATTDRETLPFPEEEANNGAETSGAAHLTDAPISATERARTRPALRTDTSKSETNTDELSQTQTALMVDSSNRFHSTDTDKHATSRMFKHKYEFTTTQAHTAVSTLESGTISIAQVGAVSGTTADKQLHSARSQRSIDKLSPDPNSSVTTDPLKPTTESPRVDPSSARTDTGSLEPTASSQVPLTTGVTEHDSAISTSVSLSSQPNTAQADLFQSALVSTQTDISKSLDKFDNHTDNQSHILMSTQTQANSESVTLSPYVSVTFTQIQTTMESTQKTVINTYMTDVTSTVPSSSDSASAFTGSSPTFGDVQNSLAVETATETNTLRQENLPTNSLSPVPLLLSSTFQSSLLDMLETHNTVSVSSHAPVSLSSSITPPITAPPPSLAPTAGSTTSSHNFVTTTHTSLLPLTTPQSDDGHEDKDIEAETDDESLHKFLSSTVTHSPTAGRPERPPPQTTPRSRQESLMTSTPVWVSTTSQTPKFYIVPDQPAAVRVESIELLVQLIVEESRAAFTPGLEEYAAAWMEPYLRRAPGFIRLLGVWSSGHAVQSLVEFKTSEALQWLSTSGPTSLLEQTGLAQAIGDGTSFRSSKVTNITLGGLQGDVCDWLLQCPSGYKCASQPKTTNYSCSSVCRFDFCHHHGICTHHPGQPPVCRCLVGDDFWYMGQRCDVKMTRGRLVGACLAILLIMVTVIGILALVAVRRYRAALIQAKVDQTRSSYRRFNHFDELSGRFWLRSWAGSADSLDNPAFTRSDELLHLRALDRPCCYHDDTLSLASTCPSHGARINTIYPHSSQYGWRGSEMSVGDGVLDSGKASDLSVCSWPVEPIQWTPFPLLQQLASHRTNTVRVTRPRSYCEGMELVDMGKSWTA